MSGKQPRQGANRLPTDTKLFWIPKNNAVYVKLEEFFTMQTG